MTKKKKEWKVKRVSKNEAAIILPEGMEFTGKNLSIEDIIEAVQRHAVIKEGKPTKAGSEVVVKCCSGNTALA